MKGLHSNSLRKVDNPHQWMIDDARMELIQQIKAEVERRRDLHYKYYVKHGRGSSAESRYDEDVELLSFLDTLQEQPVKDFPTTDEEMKQFLATHPKVELPEKYKTPDWMFEKSEKPSEGLEEEIEYYLDHAELKAKCNGISVAQDYFDDLTNAARHFAKWGAEHRGSSEIPKELKEASEKEYPCDKSWMTDSMLDMNAHCQVAFWKGAKWDRSKLMKEAVEGKIATRIQGKLYARCQVPKTMKAEFGDTVRIIIVKEDEK